MVDAEYPELIRNQWHSSHDYTLRLSDNVDARLSPQQLISLWKQIEQDQRIDAEELVSAADFWESARCIWCEAPPGSHTADCKRKVGISDGPSRVSSLTTKEQQP